MTKVYQINSPIRTHIGLLYWMCGLYYQMSACLSYLVHLYICLVICPYIAFPSIPTLIGGNVKSYFIIVEPNLTRNLGLLGIIGFTILPLHGGLSHLSCLMESDGRQDWSRLLWTYWRWSRLRYLQLHVYIWFMVLSCIHFLHSGNTVLISNLQFEIKSGRK